MKVYSRVETKLHEFLARALGEINDPSLVVLIPWD
jgi:hypothetical protein